MNPMEYPPVLSSSTSRTSLAISKKVPPLHKRHTKPCKYYQVNRCPYSSDVCNFAHVIAPPMKESRGGEVCRHYAAGQCLDGSRCRYRHPDECEIPPPYKHDVLRVTIPDSQPGWHGMPNSNDKMHPDQLQAYAPGYSPYYPQHPHDWSYANGITMHSPVYAYGGHPPPSGAPHAVMQPRSKGRHHPVAGLGATPPFTISPSHEHPPNNTQNANHQVPHAYYASDQDDGLSTGSSSSILSASPSTDSDELLIISTTEDPNYAEHAQKHQSQGLVAGHSGVPAHMPPNVMQHPFYPADIRAPKGHGYQQRQPFPVQQHPGLYYRTATPVRYGSVTPRSASNPASRSASRNSHRVKFSKYKTKPCKYWAVDGTCPSGEECTFRHDEPYPPPVPPLPPNLDELGGPPPRLQAQLKLHTEQSLLAPPGLNRDRSQSSVSSTTSSNSKKDGFVPIAWRVIGGGVRIGNPNGSYPHTSSQSSESGPNSIYASDSEDHEGTSGFAPNGVLSDSDAARPHAAKDTSIVSGHSAAAGDDETLERSNQGGQDTGDCGGRDREGSGTSVRSRKRSNSIPPTPSSTQFLVGTLFSAESPGVL